MITPVSPRPPGIVTPRPMDRPPRGPMPPPRASITSELRPPPRRQRTAPLLPRSSGADARLVAQNGQDVPGGVLEPGDGRPRRAGDAPVVLLEAVVVALELDAPLAQAVHRRLDVLDSEVQDGVGRRREVGLRVDHGRAAREVEPQYAHGAVAHVHAERLAVEPARGVEVVHREAAE